MKWQAVTLSEADNVAMVLRPVQAGEAVGVAVGGGTVVVTALESVAPCHKIALADLAPGDPVVKYGECIGEAVLAIRRGAWVHTHNLRSRRAQRRTSP